MIHIKKHRSPKSLENFKCKHGKFGNMPKAVKEEILTSLLTEQHNLCAYCNCRIPEADAQRRNVAPVTIEHHYPQHPSTGGIRKGADVDYNNMLAVCSGNRGCGNTSDLTCDARKGNIVIKLDPKDIHHIQKIRYRNNGEIYSDNNVLNMDLNDTLNLNSTRLIENRMSVVNEVKKKLSQEKNFYPECRKILEALRDDPKPFCGMLISWLESQVKRYYR